MRIGGIDYRTTTAVAALAVVIGLTVPVVSAPGTVGLTATTSAASTIESTATDGSATSADLQVAPTAGPASTPFEPVAPQEPTASAQPQPEQRAGSGTAVSSTTAGSAGRPAATAPAKPLAAQPAPITAPTPSASPTSSGGCPAAISGTTPGAPSRTSPLGVAGTTSADLQSFAVAYNAIRVANCLAPVPFANIRYDSCMEDRLFWMAEDPSTDPMSAWGHIGSVRSDGLPSVGCDGNLAGGTDNGGAIVAQKWWDSTGHRTSLYKPTFTGSTSNVCILFSMTHGGVPNEPYSFTRAAARWVTC